MKYKEYGGKVIVQWIGMACGHGAVAYVTVYCVIENIRYVMRDGKEVGLWVGGQSVYCACIFMVNFLI